MHQFQETHPEFKGFSSYYGTQLGSYLSGIESKRKKALSKFYIGCGVCAVLCAVSSLLLWSKTESAFAATMPFIFGAPVLGGIYAWATARVSDETKVHLVGGICDFIGWRFEPSSFIGPPLSLLVNNKLLTKSFDRHSFEDQISGKAHGADFLSVECHMEKKSRDKNGNTQWTTTFRGLIMVIDFHRKFDGRTVVLRDKGIFNTKKKSGMKRVGLVDPKFEKIFEAYGTDQVEARYLLTPDFMQRLVDLEEAVDGKKLCFGFLEDKLYITVVTKNRFEAGSMLRPLTDTQRTQDLLDEIGAVYDLVDGVMKPQTR